MRPWPALFLLGALACRREPDPAVGQQVAADVTTAQAASPPGDQRSVGPWQVERIQVTLELPEGQAVAGIDDKAIEQRIVAALPKVAEALPTFGPAGPRLPVGVHLGLSWLWLDAQGQPRPTAQPGEGQVLLTVQAHVERLVERGTPDMAVRTVDATLPVPAERASDPAGLLLPRLQRAAEVAIGDALAQLALRPRTDAEVLALLDDPAVARLVPAVREVGERRLKSAQARLEKLTHDSRKDVAAVAATALGRLGNPQSVPVLKRLLEGGQPEVLDAALVALADLDTPQARALLREVAEEHPLPAARRRAEALLQTVAPK